MKKLSNHIVYSVEDIHNYFTGKLSSIEMHAMEKAALGDSLLAEAMDGYSISNSFKNDKKFSQLQNDLIFLKRKVSNHKQSYNNSWWKIAASFLLLTGACFAFYLVSHNNKSSEAGIIQQPVLPSKEVKDSTLFNEKKIISPSDNEQEDVVSNSPAKSKAVKNNLLVKKTIPNNSATLLLPEAAAPASVASADVVSEEKKSAPAENNKAARFSLSKKKLLKRDKSADTTRAASQVYLLYKSQAEPLIGWSTYLHYLQNRLSYSTYDDGRQVTGEMIVEFKIDETNNIPVNFNFEKTIDADVNDAVQELIQNGPQWKKISNTPVTGIIKLKIIF